MNKQKTNPALTESRLTAGLGLLPCPFCGGAAWLRDLAGYEAGCIDCGAMSPAMDVYRKEDVVTKDQCIKAWNRRVPNVKDTP